MKVDSQNASSNTLNYNWNEDGFRSWDLTVAGAEHRCGCRRIRFSGIIITSILFKINSLHSISQDVVEMSDFS